MSEITSIRFQASKQTINFISSTRSFLTIVVLSGASYKHKAHAMLVTGKGNQLLGLAHSVLTLRTHDQRLRFYMNQLNRVGHLDISGARISKDGWISKGNVNINLAEAWRKRHIVIGTSYEWGMFNSGKNPYEIIVGDNGLGMLSRRVSLTAYVDRDVVIQLIHHFRPVER